MKQSKYLVPGIVMLGVVLRIPFTALTPVLTDIAKGLHVSVDSLGMLTTIPLLMFALLSNLAPKIAEKTGVEKLFTYVLFLMLIGSAIRVFNLPMLYLGTTLIGVSVAMMNVMLPSLVTLNFPLRVGFYTTIYTTSMGLASAIVFALAVPLVRLTSWQVLIVMLMLIVLLALLIWLPNTANNHELRTSETSRKVPNLWKNKAALVMLIFGGIQSMLFYTETTWLPTMAQSAGLSKELAGILASYFSIISIPVSMLVPAFVGRSSARQRKWVMGIFCGMSIIGLAMLIVIQTDNLFYWILVNSLLGISVAALFPYLLTIFSLKSSSGAVTARLSGMVQAGGYLLAAIGPAMFGYLFTLNRSWDLAVTILLVLSLIMTWCLLYIERFEKVE